MSDINAVVRACKDIEHVLETQWRGRGRGMHGKLDSVAYPVPEPLAKRIRWLATMRNKAMHEAGFEIDDIDGYVASARQTLAQLQHAWPQAVATYRRRLRRQTLAVVGVALIAIAGVWASGSKNTGERSRLASEHVAQPQSSALPATSLGAGNPAATKQVITPQAKNPRHITIATLEAGGSHVGVSNAVVAFEQVSFMIGRGTFKEEEATVSLSLRNISGQTLSSVQLAARLYINGEAEPAVKLGENSQDSMWVTFGDMGLAPGASGRFTAKNIGSNGALIMPDVLRARNRMIVLRVVSASDGRNRTLDVNSDEWPVVIAGKGAPAARATASSGAPRAIDIAALREIVRSGAHVGFGDGQVGIENVKVSLARGSFDRQEVRVQAEIVNNTQATLSSVSIEGWLLWRRDGASNVIALPEDRGRNTFFAFLGEQGLPAGQRRSLTLYQSSGEMEWRSPDALSAVGSGQSQVVLRALDYQDGRKATHTLATPAVKPLL